MKKVDFVRIVLKDVEIILHEKTERRHQNKSTHMRLNVMGKYFHHKKLGSEVLLTAERTMLGRMVIIDRRLKR